MDEASIQVVFTLAHGDQHGFLPADATVYVCNAPYTAAAWAAFLLPGPTTTSVGGELVPVRLYRREVP